MSKIMAHEGAATAMATRWSNSRRASPPEPARTESEFRPGAGLPTDRPSSRVGDQTVSDANVRVSRLNQKRVLFEGKLLCRGDVHLRLVLRDLDDALDAYELRPQIAATGVAGTVKTGLDRLGTPWTHELHVVRP